MKKTNVQKRLSAWKVVVALLCAFVLYLLPCFSNPTAVSAYTGDVIAINNYQTDVTVRTDRKVEVKEKITVTFLQSGLTMFYRSLPMEGAKYEKITASCDGNDAFSYSVATNPDVDGFLDINCKGNANKGQTWTYEIAFTMQSVQNGAHTENGMHIDVIPFGFTVPLHNVSATMHFPAPLKEQAKLYVGYGASENTSIDKTYVENADGTSTLSFHADTLKVNYNSAFGEWVADGISVAFNLPENTLQPYKDVRLFTGAFWWLLFGVVVMAGLGVLLFIFTHKKREIVPIVNLKAPDDMDPLKMGKILDGTVDNEDVTSMIYYFAHNGYLDIDFSNQDNPLLIRKVQYLPQSAPAYQKTLYEGLFHGDGAVRISQLKYRFYATAEKAKTQVSGMPMYEKKSRLGFYGGGVLGALFALVSAFLLGRINLGGGYTYLLGGVLIVPAICICVVAEICENYRYKWKAGKRALLRFCQYAIAGVATLLFVGAFGAHFSTGYERLLIALGAFLPTFLCLPALSRTEEYCSVMGDILGFKEFITVTEEDKIKEMLEYEPQLYYKVLPYAQVLGVTDVWEEKFEKITLQPPQWCVGGMSFFDYLLLNRIMRTATLTMLMRPEPKGGSFVGRSGGGGHFGGFGGGGFGGGGGGAR
jgi:hypothetical protein